MCLRIECIGVLICVSCLFLFVFVNAGFVGGFCLESAWCLCLLLGGLPSSHALFFGFMVRWLIGVCSLGLLGLDRSLLLLLSLSVYVRTFLSSVLCCCRVSFELFCLSLCLDLSRSLLLLLLLCLCEYDVSVRGCDDVDFADLCPSRNDFCFISSISALVYPFVGFDCLLWLRSLLLS